MLGLLKPLLSKQPHRLGEMFTVMCLLNSCLMFSKIMNLYVVGLKYYVRYFLAWRAIFVIRCFALFTAEMKKSFKNIFPLKMSTGWRHLLLSRRRRRKCRFHFPEEGFSFLKPAPPTIFRVQINWYSGQSYECYMFDIKCLEPTTNFKTLWCCALKFTIVECLSATWYHPI